MTRIVCECGEPLLDDLEAAAVVIDDDEIPFRRGSDFVACGSCGAVRSILSVRAEATADGTLDPDDVELPPTISQELQEAADEALRALREMSGGDGDAWTDDYADVVLSALSDIHHEDAVAGEPVPPDVDTGSSDDALSVLRDVHSEDVEPDAPTDQTVAPDRPE